MTGNLAARRAVTRWALRLFRREWRQQLLVLTLLTVAVAAAVAGLTIAVNATSDSAGEYGSATAQAHVDAADAASATSTIASVRQRFGAVDVIAHTSTALPGSVRPLDVRDTDPHGTFSRPTLGVRSGRYPTAAGEVALTHDAAVAFDATVGSTVMIAGTARTVVGIVENPADLKDQFALLAPGAIVHADGYTVLLDLDGHGGVPTGDAPGSHLPLDVRDTTRQAVATVVLATITLAMALAGLVATAGFLVVAQRRQRQLGLLTAIGATDRHVRMVMIANGVFVGVTAAVVGTSLGIAGWIAAEPAVESAANHRIGRFDLPLALIAAIAALAVVMATLAAWWPARTASKLPVMAALSGRPASPKPVHRSLLVAVLLVGGGAAAIIVADPTTDQIKPVLFMAGLLAVIIGGVFFAPGAIRVLGLVAKRLPFAPRLALRDLARYQSRAAAALAAITLGLSLAIAVVVISAANQDRSNQGNLSSHELLIQAIVLEHGGSPDSSAADVAGLDAKAATIAAAIGHGTTATPLDVAYVPTVAADPAAGSPAPAGGKAPIAVGRAPDAHTLEFLGYPYVATADVLALYGIDPGTIQPSTDLLSGRGTDVQLLGEADSPRPDKVGHHTQAASLPTYSDAPSALITPAALARYGWKTTRAGWIIELPHALTSRQITAARRAAADVGLGIETRDSQDVLANLRTGGTAIGALLAMAIVAMAVGLIRGEATRDIRTLTATGAEGRTRRSLTASTAAALALLGVLLGLLGAYVALIASYRSHLDKLVPIPYDNLLELAVGVPVLAAAAGWLMSGRAPKTFSRQALD
ncbi:MAG: hypothetical protein JWM34_2355 [Ilumatobacteraceae bacterium]|nr:hypothetical protein [Ilumatobacteraceae bacterium]